MFPATGATFPVSGTVTAAQGNAAHATRKRGGRVSVTQPMAPSPLRQPVRLLPLPIRRLWFRSVPTPQWAGLIADPCLTIAAKPIPRSASRTASVSTRIIAPTSAKKTYICYLFLTSAAAAQHRRCGADLAGHAVLARQALLAAPRAATVLTSLQNGGVQFTKSGLTVLQ